MRQLIEIKQKNQIKCDNTSCDYAILNRESSNPLGNDEQYINKPCPDCGENLLTQKDYDDYQSLMAVIRWLNKWFSWITYFIPKSVVSEIKVKVHNGIHMYDKDGKKL